MMKHAFAVTLAATLALGLLAACPAVASHYVLSSVDVVEEAMVPRLAAIGIQTTEDLWNQTRTPKQIKKVARKMGVSTAKVKDWHDFCDLLRAGGGAQGRAGASVGGGSAAVGSGQGRSGPADDPHEEYQYAVSDPRKAPRRGVRAGLDSTGSITGPALTPAAS